MIRPAEPRDHAQIKALWMDVFGDTETALALYFALRHRDEDMLVWAEDGRIDGMLSMLPFTLMHGQKAYPARYIYAVATAPKQRGRGIAGALLEDAAERIRAGGEAAAALVPASESLFDYYEKRGFHTAFSLNVVDVGADALPPCPDGTLSRCESGEYMRMRDLAFSGDGLYVRWDARAVDYAIRSLGEDGGALRFSLNGGEGAALWSRMDGGVLVRELALMGVDMPSALALLHRELKAPTYRVRLRPGDAGTPFGMVRWFVPPPAQPAPGYLSLALD